MSNELISIGEVTIPFYEDNLIVQLGEDGNIYVALRPIVEVLGLNWSGQLQRIKRDAVLGKHLKTLSERVAKVRKKWRDESFFEMILVTTPYQTKKRLSHDYLPHYTGKTQTDCNYS